MAVAKFEWIEAFTPAQKHTEKWKERLREEGYKVDAEKDLKRAFSEYDTKMSEKFGLIEPLGDIIKSLIKKQPTKSITIKNIDLSRLKSAIERGGKRPHELTGKQCTPEARRKLEIIKKYCVGRDNAFVVRYGGESSYKVDEKVTDDVIIGYLNGEYKLVLYPQYQNKRNDKKRDKWRCRRIALDIDCHDEHFTPENMEKISESCDILISNCKDFFLFDDPKYIIKERSAHGWYLIIVLKKDTAQEDAGFYRDIIFNKINLFIKERHKNIYPNNQQVEIFPKGLVHKGGYGIGFKPFFNKFSDLDEKVKIQELELSDIIKNRKEKYNQYVLNSRKSYSQNTVNSSYIYTEKTDFCEWKKKHKNSLHFFLDNYTDKWCIKNVIKGISQCSGSVGRTMAIKTVNLLNSLGYSEDVIIQAFKNQQDFDYNRTKKEVKDLIARNYCPPICKTTRAIGFCDSQNCPKAKPVSLEYDYSETLPQEVKGFDGLHKLLAKLIKFIIRKKESCFLRKTTRSGTTTATFIQSAKLRKKMLMIAPTKRIFNETLEDAKIIGLKEGYLNAFTDPRCYRVGSSLKICDKVKESIEGFEDILNVFPFLLKPRCSKCERNNFWESKIKKDPDTKRCGFQDFLNNINTYDMIYLSTWKFKTLINASKYSPEARDLLDILIDWCDFIFFDECYNLFSVNFKDYELYSIDEKENETDNLVNVFEVIKKLKRQNPDSYFLDEFENFLKKIDDKVINDFLCVDKSKIEELPKSWYENIFKRNRDWAKWYSIMINYYKETKDYKIRNLVDIFLSLNSKQLYIQQQISYSVRKSPKERRIILGCVDDIPSFINWTKTLSKPFLMTDAVKPPIDLNILFNNVKEVNINDPNETAKKQTIIICQQYDPFYRGTKFNKEIIIDFLEKYGLEKELFLVTQSKKYNRDINYILKEKALNKLKIGEKTYHRSDLTIGTASNLRRMVCIGSSFIPRHSYDYVAEVYKSLGFFPSDVNTESIARVLENHEARSSFFQTISRVKDPYGKEESEVFIFGMKGEIVADWFKSFNIAVPEILSEKEYIKRRLRKKPD